MSCSIDLLHALYLDGSIRWDAVGMQNGHGGADRYNQGCTRNGRQTQLAGESRSASHSLNIPAS